jgi:hypothetical protein
MLEDWQIRGVIPGKTFRSDKRNLCPIVPGDCSDLLIISGNNYSADILGCETSGDTICN